MVLRGTHYVAESNYTELSCLIKAYAGHDSTHPHPDLVSHGSARAITVANQTHRIYTASHLCFGAKASQLGVVMRLREVLVKVGEATCRA